MKFPIRLLVLVVLVPASLVLAGVEVDYEESADFSGYRTYAWEKGTPAARPEVQKLVVAAVERELQSKGLRPAVKPPADLYVVTAAFAELGIASSANYHESRLGDVGLITAHTIGTADGTLVVDILDGESKEPVWRAVAREPFKDRTPLDKIEKKIDKIAKKMFKDFPPE